MFAYRLSGVTLIELLIGLLLGAFILAAVTGIYVVAEKNQQLQTALNNIQENARSAIEFLQMDVHNAGNSGCANLAAPFAKISGADNTITIRSAGLDNAILSEDMQDTSVMYVTKNINFKAGDLAIISSCMSAEIFTVQAINSISQEQQRIQAASPLSQHYNKNASLSFFNNNTYFVSDTGRRDVAGLPVYALYVKNGNKPKKELVQGVHAMQLNYVVSQANQLRTLAASEVNDWSAVIGVKINLTLDSVSDYALQKPWFFYLRVG